MKNEKRTNLTASNGPVSVNENLTLAGFTNAARSL